MKSIKLLSVGIIFLITGMSLSGVVNAVTIKTNFDYDTNRFTGYQKARELKPKVRFMQKWNNRAERIINKFIDNKTFLTEATQAINDTIHIENYYFHTAFFDGLITGTQDYDDNYRSWVLTLMQFIDLLFILNIIFFGVSEMNLGISTLETFLLAYTLFLPFTWFIGFDLLWYEVDIESYNWLEVFLSYGLIGGSIIALAEALYRLTAVVLVAILAIPISLVDIRFIINDAYDCLLNGTMPP